MIAVTVILLVIILCITYVCGKSTTINLQNVRKRGYNDLYKYRHAFYNVQIHEVYTYWFSRHNYRECIEGTIRGWYMHFQCNNLPSWCIWMTIWHNFIFLIGEVVCILLYCGFSNEESIKRSYFCIDHITLRYIIISILLGIGWWS